MRINQNIQTIINHMASSQTCHITLCGCCFHSIEIKRHLHPPPRRSVRCVSVLIYPFKWFYRVMLLKWCWTTVISVPIVLLLYFLHNSVSVPKMWDFFVKAMPFKLDECSSDCNHILRASSGDFCGSILWIYKSCSIWGWNGKHPLIPLRISSQSITKQWSQRIPVSYLLDTRLMQ